MAYNENITSAMELHEKMLKLFQVYDSLYACLNMSLINYNKIVGILGFNFLGQI